MQKPNPSLFLKVMSEYLNRMLVKKIIPIDYADARMQTYFDMVSLFPIEHQELFKQALEDFESSTDVKAWYEDTDE